MNKSRVRKYSVLLIGTVLLVILACFLEREPRIIWQGVLLAVSWLVLLLHEKMQWKGKVADVVISVVGILILALMALLWLYQ